MTDAAIYIRKSANDRLLRCVASRSDSFESLSLRGRSKVTDAAIYIRKSANDRLLRCVASRSDSFEPVIARKEQSD